DKERRMSRCCAPLRLRRPSARRAICRLAFMAALEKRQRIDRRGVFANLEMHLGRADISGLAGFPDNFAALDLVASLHVELFRVCIDGDVVVGMAHEREIAETFKSVAGINHHAILGGLDRRVLWYGDIDAVVLLAVELAAEARKDLSLDRPLKDR